MCKQANKNMKNKFFIFDVETTGLPPKGRKYATYRDTDHWPRIVQISWCVTEDLKENINVIHDAVIKPQGFTIPQESSDIHRITQEIANRDGLELRDVVLSEIKKDLEGCTHVVAHNLSFDSSIFLCELYRMKENCLIAQFASLKQVCTKNIATPYCKLRPFRYGSFKWPTLNELYYVLENKIMDSEKAHNSKYDVEILIYCFQGLIERGLVDGIVYKNTRSGLLY